MRNNTFSEITPVFFLQTFILELIHASEQLGHDRAQQLIEHIARTAGRFFEEAYRDTFTNKNDALPIEQYIDLILGLKNNIGGNFSLASSTPTCIAVSNTRCPFGEKVTDFPELCRMTSSVFGGIAARNYGYAKVEIKKSIARHDGCCEVYVHLNEEEAKNKTGTEYRNDWNNNQHNRDFDELHSRIEESMLKIWRKQVQKTTKHYQPPTIIAQSEAMKQVLKHIEIIAPTIATVLIRGQTGVGKELIARAIHAMSERSNKPFIPINCGAIPESLIESVLFGHEKGAFTGAIDVHQGYFEQAQGGTLFLDEVDSLSPAAQTRLLRVIQEGELIRVGGKQIIQVDLRIISATNVLLEEQIEQGLFRHDLYYRLNVVNLLIPPLVERPEDLAPLVNMILQKMNKKHHKSVQSVSSTVMNKIRAYHWPGNVRELENVLERCLLFCHSDEITEISLDVRDTNTEITDWKQQKQLAIDQVEKSFIEAALMQYHGDINKIAEAMSITSRAVYQKLNKYHMDPHRYRKH